MSIITLQVGQCGNHLGCSFYDFLYKEIEGASPAHQAACLETFFRMSEKGKGLKAPSLLIDMEPKVVNRCLNKGNNSQWFYDKDYSFSKQEGSGNNWAYGYNFHGRDCEGLIMEKFEKLLEELDTCEGVLLFQSLAGGTGSGLGSYLLEKLRENHPELGIINVAVLPHLTGEVILQNFNCVLSLASLYQNADGVILVENDNIQNICNELLHLKRPSVEEMNRVISHQLCSLFFPVFDSASLPNAHSALLNRFKGISDICENLLLNPLYKLLKIFNVPQMPDSSKQFNNDTWSALEKRIFQMMLGNTIESKINWSMKPNSLGINKSIANMMIYRGNDVSSVSDATCFDQKEVYHRKAIKLSCLRDSHLFNKNEKSINVLSNSQAFVSPLDCIVEKAYQMFKEKAFLYQYKKFKLEEDDFLESLAYFEQIIFNYKNLN